MPPAPHEVGQWEIFEVALENRARYADPYNDVTLEVTYTRPDGSTVAFWGFYDGDATWRARFMPDQRGRWHYAARFSDGTPGGAGTFVCGPSAVPGMVSVDEANPRWFGFQGGRHWLMRSLHVGDRFFAANFPAARRAAFLDWATAQGYNTLSVASHYLNRDAPGRGRGWDTPQLWPLDAAAYRRLERHLDDLAARRIAVFPFAGFFGRDSVHPTAPAEQAAYLRYALARIGPYWNVLLNVAGPEPLLAQRPYLDRETIDRLGALIRRRDVFGHPLTVHNATGDDAFRDAPWLDFGTLQGPKTTDLAELGAGLLRNHHPAKPLYAQETLWSGNRYHPNYTDTQLRKNAYVLMMSAAALNFADNGGPTPGAVGNSSSGFSGTLDLADRRQERHDIVRQVWDVFETLPFYRMAPRPDVVSGHHALAEPGARYLVYLPQGGAVDVAVVGAPYAVTWINAQAPDDRREGPRTRDGQGLHAPDDGDDWLLLLEHT